MVVREALGAAVPSAGVACAIARDMLGRIADRAGGLPFDPACMTEDYELGLRIKALGGRGALVRIATSAGTGTGVGVVATREHFPSDLEAALRQKTRWLLGIAFGGWDRLGWQGSFVDRLMLMRDRKSIVAALLTMLGYVAAAMAALDVAATSLVPGARNFAPLVAPGSWLAATLVFTSWILAWRLIARAGFTTYIHGWREGLRAVPRVAVANMINAMAAWRAVRRYLAIRRGRMLPTWDKTAHRFPGVT